MRYQAAIQLVERLSGVHRPALTGFLQWEGMRQAALYDGHFRFYVPVQTSVVKDLHPTGRSTVIRQFDVYRFDPWTGTFLGKKKMKTVDGWEVRSGSSSGLLPR